MADPKKKKQSITEARLRVCLEHEKAQQAEQAGVELMGEKVKHE